MPWTWVTGRCFSARRPRGEGVRLREEIAEIELLCSEAACRFCGVEAALTEEHAGPKKAGNVGQTYVIPSDPLVVPPLQGPACSAPT
jgi:hypothetical protein